MIGIILALLPAPGDKEVSEAQKMSEKDFIQNCETYDYKTLVRKSDDYVGKAVRADVRIEQIVEDGTIRAYSGDMGESPENWYDEEWVLKDQRDGGDKLVENDVMTVYGIYTGAETVERIIGGTDEVPQITVLYTSESETLAKIEAVKDKLKFKKTSDEYGWKTYKAKLKNPIDTKFDYFSVDINLKKGDTVVENTTAIVENWKAGEKATFEFETDNSFDEIVVENIEYYKN